MKILALAFSLALSAVAMAQDVQPRINPDNIHLRIRIAYEGEIYFSNEVYMYQQFHMDRVILALQCFAPIYSPDQYPRRYVAWVNLHYTQKGELNELELEVVELVGGSYEQVPLYTHTLRLEKPRDVDQVRLLYAEALFKIANP